MSRIQGRTSLLALALTLSSVGASTAQVGPGVPDTPEAVVHVQNAARIAGADLAATARMLCMPSMQTIRVMQADAQSHPPPAPLKVFDNLYFVGLRSVGAWVIQTSDGLILIDTLDNPQEAETYVAGGLRKLGLNPKSIKDIVVTHAHGDHYGGAQYLHDTYGSKIWMSEADWSVLAAPRAGGPPNWGAPPKKDQVLSDGQRLVLGDTAVTVVLTPGHTPGTVSLIFPVKDRGAPHMAMMWGGTGQPAAGPSSLQYEASIKHFAEFADRANVDVEVSNHPQTDGSLDRMEAMSSAKAPSANPFVLSHEAIERYLGIHEECLLAARARPPQRPAAQAQR